MKYANGDIFRGVWKADYRYGPGTYVFKNGYGMYSGLFRYDYPVGSYASI
jgi:hypothetical protein